ncbi:hypothetical protein MFIFM68171_08475 [Madurella fahalii]|uniref:Nephrocystin 3-like N-terminal domain-containing protein n=1 Tax=Madurella fahalii TaxID=1157608 RepID=A0ABQ0GKQ2_9PEZI
MDTRPSSPEAEGAGYGVFSSSRNNAASGSASQYNAPVTIYHGAVHSFEAAGTATPNLDKRREEILNRLEVPQYEDPKDQIPYKLDGIGDWFLSHTEFQTWKDSESSRLLWLSAEAGCGKSVLIKHLTETLSSGTVCYFFFDTGSKDRRSIVSALRHMLSQLFSRDHIPLPSTNQLPPDMNKSGPGQFDKLWQLLLYTAKRKGVGEIVCLLDAVDECDPQEWVILSEALCRLYKSKDVASFKLKFLLTSQPYDRIYSKLCGLFKKSQSPASHLRGETEPEKGKISHDIGVFIESRVQDPALHIGPETRRLLGQRLLSSAHRTYLRAHHTLKSIEKGGKINRDRVMTVTSQLTDELRNAYTKILNKSGDVAKANRVLQIVVAAAEPLTVAEMASALAIMSDGDDVFDIEPGNDFIIRESCGLVTVVDGTIHLLDETVAMMLQAQRLPAGPADAASKRHNWHSPSSHFTLARCCIRYLLQVEFEMNPLGRDGPVAQYLQDHPFLNYAARHWSTHFRQSPTEKQFEMAAMVRALCGTSSKRFLTWFRVCWANLHAGGEPPDGLTDLMAASYFGLVQTVAFLLVASWDGLHERDKTYKRSALHWAALGGHVDVVQLLLKNGARMAIFDKDKQMPLNLALAGGHAAVVRLFLETGDDLTVADEDGWPSLEWPLHYGYFEMVQLLLNKGNGLTLINKHGWTLLHSAAGYGHLGALRLLLDKGANPAIASANGWTPLMSASRHGHVEAVSLLLEKEADPSARNNIGFTPLHMASGHGHVRVVKALLDKGANTASLDCFGNTPLNTAASLGQRAAVKLLLGTTGSGQRNNFGCTPLFQAAANGHEAVVELLLKNNFYTEFAERNGNTPLLAAACNGHVAAAKLLLEAGANPDAFNADGNTSLLLAAANGHEAIVKLLLGKGANPTFANRFGITPLQAAPVQNSDGIVGADRCTEWVWFARWPCSTCTTWF